MELDEEHIKVLRSVFDTFAPGDGSIPKASQVGTAERFAEWAAANLDAAQRLELSALLGRWNLPITGLISEAGSKCFADLDQVQRERILLSCARSRSRVQAGRVPVTENRGAAGVPIRNRVHTDLGVQRVPRTARRRVPCAATGRASSNFSDTTLDCGVVIVGSGTGSRHRGSCAGIFGH